MRFYKALPLLFSLHMVCEPVQQQSKRESLIMQSLASGEGQPIVLIGGGLQGADSWGPLVARLESTRRVIRLQNVNVGFGLKNDKLPSGYSVDMESAAAKRALDDLGIKHPVDIVGWSSGGAIALDLALDHPERIRSVTRIEPIAIWVLGSQEQNDPALTRMIGLARTLRGQISDDQFEAFMCGNGTLNCSAGSPRSSPLWPRLIRYKQALNGLAAYVDHTDNLEWLKRFRKPVLIVTGSQSASFAKRINQSLAKQLASAEVLDLPGGHASFLNSTDLFVEKLSLFLQQVERTAQEQSR